ncbi:MAG: aminotransferase class IV [Proteobacteria bacterium]|nr:aminotransferase class IV [Pseudomonadota bacterium]
MTDVVVSIDGHVVAPEAATISIFDRGFLYGDGVFTVLRTLGPHPVDLARHLDRLYASAAELGLRGLARAAVEQAVHQAIAHGTPGDRRVRIVLTRGAGGLGTPGARCGPGRAIVVVEGLGSLPSELALATVDLPIARRPAHKSLAFAEHLAARELAWAVGADEAVRLGPAGEVVEGATCNLFAVVDGVLVTPALTHGALPGIVRGRILERWPLAVERTLALEELRLASEIFVTSSLRGVVPVTRFDGRVLDRGPITAQVATTYRDALRFYI